MGVVVLPPKKNGRKSVVVLPPKKNARKSVKRPPMGVIVLPPKKNARKSDMPAKKEASSFVFV